jgi:putative oxidoreductase
VAPFTIGSALLFRQFCASPPDQQMMQNISFFKNAAVAGGLLFVVAFGPGASSLVARSGRA